MIELLLFALAVKLSEDDPELVRRLKNREPQAMAELYDRYARLTYALIFRIVRNGPVAEDLVQETFLRIWNRVHGFDAERGAFGPWILAVARNRAIDYLRSIDGRTMQTPFELEKMEEPSQYADFERHIMNVDRARLLREAFVKLSPNQRVVIELAYYEGLSQSEMATRLRQPLGTVKTLVRSALKRLREHLGERAALA